jgi:POLO box duplicated region
MIYTKHPSAIHAANIWVVRYVDYTSKYGLGFLLNTGSAGVYFNDSTKIIVSPDGCSFQYNERKRKEKGMNSSEHTIQSHSVSRYPMELQKKVTLLRHFRNYLVDQQKGGKRELEVPTISSHASILHGSMIAFSIFLITSVFIFYYQVHSHAMMAVLLAAVKRWRKWQHLKVSIPLIFYLNY